MELKIGKNTYETKILTADFPIRFFKETGVDIFGIEDDNKTFIELYEIYLNLAYALTGSEKTLEEFSREFTPYDLVQSIENIFACYMETTSPNVASETEKK
ncbi:MULTISPECIES: hypothetical protein [Gemella]|uniref:hypothetical protein n=1 Tax=Gemella TaxID=1378 RepID=UPI00093075C0|nr:MULTISPECIES: hypothetical protein [Gemella]AXI27260.1 hypothetical protein CG018_07520 [Gemella sp. ND 6198]